MSKVIHVAVGVILNDNNEVLIAFRSPDKHQGGLWEFPGGKLEDGESVESALHRELQEELGLTPLSFKPFLKIEHDYGDKEVLLDIWEIREFRGEAKGMEGQIIKWLSLSELGNYQFPEANRSIVDYLRKRA